MVIKFFVVIFCFCEVSLQDVNYCELCTNHTLCKYKSAGPNDNCLGYEKNAHLTERDLKDILERVNYRRNYVALQSMRRLPGAANMRKMEWSSELAVMAQRWADQCDANTLPDKLDECRDTGAFRVGQNIATISGLSRSVNIKTFVDIWFIESLEYSGTVIYYDESRDNRTNYFTQLIWAETDKVGCGRVRFHIDRINGFTERLVCNFGPKGNIHGQPVYIVGFPATQCPENMIPDMDFNGLCTYNPHTKDERSTLANLDEHSKKLKLPRKFRSGHKMNRKKHKNANNAVTQNSSFVAVKRSNSELYDERLSTKEPKYDHRPEEKGHSRVHNNHNHRMDFDPIHPNANKDWKDYETIVTSSPSLNQNYRRHNLYTMCTRKHNSVFDLNATTRKSYDDKLNILCTRGKKKLCPTTLSTIFNLCPCYTQKKQCSSSPSENNLCDSNIEVKQSNLAKNKNIVARRSNFSMGALNEDQKYYEKFFQDFLRRSHKVSLPAPQTTLVNTVLSTPTYSERLRRETEPYTSEPFWKINNPSKQLKDLRYTTISNRKNMKYQKTSRIPQTKSSRTTEFITINKDTPASSKPLTEKYLSFDELLHLRKSSTANFRRAEGGEELYDDETRPANLPNYTLTTAFTRVKYCTRKLTCTWTAAFLTDADGNPKGLNNAAGIGNAYGSRTPAGYVEGCTRTSTCTRDFMYRNKGAELTTVSTVDPNAHGEDEDYCERRSLKKRHIFNKNLSNTGIKSKSMNKNNKAKTPFNTHIEYIKTKTTDTYVRNYRHVKQEKEKDISYGELYYLVVKRLIESWEFNKKKYLHKNCVCSSGGTILIDIYLFIFVSTLHYKTLLI